MCGASEQGSLTEEECLQERPLNDLEYFPKTFPKDKFKPFELTHILATLSISTNKITQTQFCDDNGNNIIPLCMMNGCFQDFSTTNYKKAIPKIEETPLNLIRNNEISTWDKDSNEEETKPIIYDASLELEERTHIQRQTKQELTSYQIQNKHHKSLRKKKPTSKFKNKRDYLTRVNANDCIKDRITGIYTITSKNTEKQKKTQQNKTPQPKTKTKKEQTKENQQAKWSTDWEDSQEENTDKLSVPSHFKKYTVANRKIVLKQPMREIPQDKISYDLPKLSKIVNLAQPGEESKPV